MITLRRITEYYHCLDRWSFSSGTGSTGAPPALRVSILDCIVMPPLRAFSSSATRKANPPHPPPCGPPSPQKGEGCVSFLIYGPAPGDCGAYLLGLFYLRLNLNRLRNPKTSKQIQRSTSAGSPLRNPVSIRAAAGRVGERRK